MKTRKLIAQFGKRVETRRTASNYTHVVFYFDGRRPTWHTSQELAQRKATNADTIVRCQEA